MILPPAVVIHGPAHRSRALAPGHPVLLLSAPAAASYAGAAWWHALTRHAPHPATPQPAALDCADHPGRALEALAVGCPIIILHPGPASPGIAARAGTTLILQHRPPALDLATPGAERHLERWLLGDSDALFR